MYTAIVVALMLVLPVLSIVVERTFLGTTLSAALVGRWFVFWAVGVRLFVAGVRQIVQPAYTAEVILGLKSMDAHFLVRELGFATTAIGIVALLSIVARSWTIPIALVAVVFYGLAGINHLFHADRNQLQNVAMVSDIFIAVVLAIYVVLATWQRP